jgi:stage IV sporulation protein B
MKISKNILKKQTCFASLVLAVALLFALPVAAENTDMQNKLYYPGGMPFGVKITTPGVMIISTSEISCGGQRRSPATEAGLKAGDTITGVNGNEVKSVIDVTTALSECGGKALSIEYTRKSAKLSTTLTPLIPDGENSYKAGMWIRDSMAGIGTVTFIDPQSGNFGGLGHGICDSESEELIPFETGVVSSVTISGIIKGRVGTPGELRGYFSPGNIGTLTGNSECGVFGKFTSMPNNIPEEALPIARAQEVHEGDAYIWCTLDRNEVGKYKIQLCNISDNTSQNTKCFTIKVTDPVLLEKTGGIVQGMSGSPIIQDGKLVGAVTHVLINDPTTGYGIFIENMLDAAA